MELSTLPLFLPSLTVSTLNRKSYQVGRTFKFGIDCRILRKKLLPGPLFQYLYVLWIYLYDGLYLFGWSVYPFFKNCGSERSVEWIEYRGFGSTLMSAVDIGSP